MLKNKSTRILYDREGKEGLPDGIISTDDEDEDDNDADDGGATKLLPHVYSFFGSASQAPADDAEWELPVATPASHAPSHATALSSSGATSVTTSAPASVGGRGSTRRPPLPTQRSHSRSRRPWPSSGRGHPADRGDRCCALRASPHQRASDARAHTRGRRAGAGESAACVGGGWANVGGPSLTHRFVTDHTRRLKSSSPKEEAEL